MPGGKVFTKEEVTFMLEAPSLPSPDQKQKYKSAAKEGPRPMKNCAQTLHNRKVNLPREVKNAPGASIPNHSCFLTSMNLQCYHVNSMSYTDFKTVSRAVLTGALTPEQFKHAQRDDNYIAQLIRRKKKLKKFSMIDNHLYFKIQFNLKLVLPASLLDIVINAKHFTVFGLHFSRSRIARDIQQRYHVQQSVLTEKLKKLVEKLSNFPVQCKRRKRSRTPQNGLHLLSKDDMGSQPDAKHAAYKERKPCRFIGSRPGHRLHTNMPNARPKNRNTIEAIWKTIIKPFGIMKFL
jgi:hypothetical protein